MPVMESEVILGRPRGEVFAFFEDPRNLEEITPPWLRFRILPPRVRRVRRGSVFAYGLRIHGAPVLWVSLITRHDPPRAFTDVQLVGPYLKWVHTHTFEEVPGGTRVRDRVEYLHAGGPWIEQRFVRPDLERIFAFRREVLQRRFG